MKYKIFFIPLFCIFLSCTSTVPNILPTYMSADIQQYYIRQEIIKKNPIDSMFDFTIIIENGQMHENVVVNYSIAVKDFPTSKIEDIDVAFLSGDEKFPLTFTNIIFNDLQKQVVRISATLTSTQFIQLVQSTQPRSVRFSHPDLETVIITSKGLNKKLSETSFLL